MSEKTDAGDIAGGIVLGAFFVLLLASWAKCSYEEDNPCEETVKATVHGRAPDGTPAEIQTSWCGKYKPGKGPTP